MNRFKKELRKKGIKLECDYPFIPYEMKHVTLEAVEVDSEICTVAFVFTSIIEIVKFDRSMNPVPFEYNA